VRYLGELLNEIFFSLCTFFGSQRGQRQTQTGIGRALAHATMHGLRRNPVFASPLSGANSSQEVRVNKMYCVVMSHTVADWLVQVPLYMTPRASVPKVWNSDVVKRVAVLRSLFGKIRVATVRAAYATFHHHSGFAITAKRHNMEAFARDSIAVAAARAAADDDDELTDELAESAASASAASSSCIELSAVREAIGVTASSGSRRSHDDYARHADDDDDIDMVRQHQQTTVSRGSGASSATISSDRGARGSRGLLGDEGRAPA